MRNFASRINSENLMECLIDTHCHCGGMDPSNFYKGRYPTSQDILDLNAKRYRAGVDYQLVCSMQTSAYFDIPAYWKNNVFTASGYCEYPFQLENENLLMQINRFKLDRLLPFLSFSLQDKTNQQYESILRLAETYPIYGLKYHTKVDQKSAGSVDLDSNFIEIARLLNIPILFHTEEKGCSSAVAVLALAKRHPDVRFCVAHFGGFSRAFFKELSESSFDNIYIDTCPLLPQCAALCDRCSDQHLNLDYAHPVSVLAYFMEHFPTKMLWATDEPWTNCGRINEMEHEKMSMYGYQSEVDVITSTKWVAQMTSNTICYLFGR